MASWGGWEWHSISLFLGFQVWKVWLGASTLAVLLEDTPAPSYMLSSLGWVTQVATRIGLGSVILFFSGYLLKLATEIKHPSPSPWKDSERRGWGRPSALSLPRHPPLGLYAGHPSAPSLSLAHSWTLAPASGELPSGIPKVPHTTSSLSLGPGKGSSCQIGFVSLGIFSGCGVATPWPKGNMEGRARKGHQPPCGHLTPMAWVWNGCPGLSKSWLENSLN